MSTTPRIFLQKTSGGSLELPDNLFRHLCLSRRLRAGDVFSTFDGNGVDTIWKVTGLTRDQIIAVRENDRPFSNPPRLELTLAFSPLKGGRSDDVVASCTQLGVSHFIPVVCARTIARLDGKDATDRKHRWGEICAANSGFSLRSDVASVGDIIGFDAIKSLTGYDYKYIFYEDELHAADVLNLPDGSKVIAIIGPEGGFEKGEVDAASEAGYSSASLGPYLLKADTAALKAASIIMG